MKKKLISIFALIALLVVSCKPEINLDPASANNAARVGAIVEERIVYFDENTTDADRDAVRNAVENLLNSPIALAQVCECSKNIQTWRAVGLSRVKVTTTIIPQGRTYLLSVEGTPVPAAIQNKLMAIVPNIAMPMPSVFGSSTGNDGKNKELKQHSNKENPVKIVVMDTGLEMKDRDEENKTFFGSGGIDEKYIDMNKSYDFETKGAVSEDIDTDNQHGTAVTSFLVGQLALLNNDNFVIIPYQVYEKDTKVAHLSTVLCGLMKAYLGGADVVNMSMGYYGDPSMVLELVIERLNEVNKAYGHNTLVVVAAGNGNSTTQALDIRAYPFYPALYSNLNTISPNGDSQRPNLITITSLSINGSGQIVRHYNYSSSFVDIGIATEQGTYKNPSRNGTNPFIQGSSFSTPIAAAYMADWISKHPTGQKNKQHIIEYLTSRGVITTSAPENATVNNNCIGCADVEE